MRNALFLFAFAALCGCSRQPRPDNPADAPALFEQARALILADDACAADRSAACALLARAAALGHAGAKDLLWAVGNVEPEPDACDCQGGGDEM